MTTEAQFQGQVVGLAAILGWESVHFRAAMTKHGWRTPGSGSMAKGWPDLTLVRERDRRLIFAELKADKGKPTPDQERVLLLLSGLAGDWFDPALLPESPAARMRIGVYLWHPKDFDQIERILR